MNIIIPIGGKGERFSNCGYKEPKPLIHILGKPMIYYLFDNLNLTPEDKVFIIYYNIDDDIFNQIINEKYPFIHLIKIQFQTKGAAETLYEGLTKIRELTNLRKIMVFDCDTFYTEDVITLYRNITENAVFYVINKDTNPIYSYIQMQEDTNTITNIVEKVKISDYANTGIYCFNNIDDLFNYSKFVVENNIVYKNECYTSCIIDQMIKDENAFIGAELNSEYVFNLGTPEQLQQYIENTFVFLFDLDGTIVLSEHVYFNIWKEILHEYDILLTEDIFKNVISGNNDETVVQSILFNKNVSTEQISQKKDNLFIKNINQIKVIDGIEETLQNIKQLGHKLAIVTNCNRTVSENILSFTQLSQYFEFIIVGNECNKPKPFPDPYNNAINRFNSTNLKTIIFEDSKTGLLSANGSSPKCIVGIETNYSKKELLKYYANITIPNFRDFDIHTLIQFKNDDENILKNHIISSLSFPIKYIHINNTKLKGGFISDVIDVKIIKDTQLLNCVIKLENIKENFLTEMSNNLDLYNREYYFYENISKDVPIKIPKFYGLIRNNTQNKNIGIFLENLNNDDYTLNLDLNCESINVSMSVINSIVALHSKFWGGKNTNHYKYLKKNNDNLFNPYWNVFITSKWYTFKLKWKNVLSEEQLNIGEYIVKHFLNIQQKLSDKNLTLCHGDVKSANIFYKIIDNTNYEPYFIDWQYIILGKGVQDLVFFMIESFTIEKMKLYKNVFKEYYYIKLLENNIDYLKEDYETDFKNATYYFPFFVAIWFGTIDEDELIDKQFPCEFIKRLFHFYTI